MFRGVNASYEHTGQYTWQEHFDDESWRGSGYGFFGRVVLLFVSILWSDNKRLNYVNVYLCCQKCHLRQLTLSTRNKLIITLKHQKLFQTNQQSSQFEESLASIDQRITLSFQLSLLLLTSLGVSRCPAAQARILKCTLTGFAVADRIRSGG